jgi:hypothetical protein
MIDAVYILITKDVKLIINSHFGILHSNQSTITNNTQES